MSRAVGDRSWRAQAIANLHACAKGEETFIKVAIFAEQ